MEKIDFHNSESDESMKAEDKAEYECLLKISERLKIEENKLHEMNEYEKEKTQKLKHIISALASTNIKLTRSMTKVKNDVRFDLPNTSQEKLSTDDDTIITFSAKRKSMFDSPYEAEEELNDNFPSEDWADGTSSGEVDNECESSAVYKSSFHTS